MAKKISQLAQATQVKSDDVTVIVQDGETKKLPLNMMVTKQDIENKKVAGLAKLDEIEATYENDTYTPTITVKNKSSVKVGEGDGVDYSANVMDGPAKSAILIGQTLVNLIPEGKQSTFHINNVSGGGYGFWNSPNVNMIKPSTKYLVLTNVTLNTGSEIIINNNEGYISCFTDGIYYEPNEVGIKKTILTSKSDLSDCTTILRSYTVTAGEVKGTIQVFEYQDGMENWDIPYFTGMQSVKMPVLTTIGKNLWDKKNFVNGVIDGESIRVSASDLDDTRFYYDFKENQQYVFTLTSYSENKKLVYFRYNYTDGTDSGFTNFLPYNGERKHFLSDEGKTISYISFVFSNHDNYTLSNIQLEEGNVATSYEPFKSNILTTPEDLELRGIGDVKDELNCLTGEVTERIGEVILDGSESWNIHSYSSDDFLLIYTDIANKSTNNLLCDKLPTWNGTAESLRNQTQSYIWANPNKSIFVWIEKSKLSEATTKGFKDYLQSNPIIANYQLKNESIKTVDLMPSGTHPSTTPYCWKNGHIQLSSSGLLPNLEYNVVTSRAGQINQNATMIVKNDKRIFDLEILLAGGLVNTTYQALTLQNQVETGLSKVSLNSETEPDYLLYHMIMKLIEEKAYKLDDLTEKVSVFYLYEKLSDEQFETIYSALYPFVEDEIVEEPVVEELPEVVEDEVIM